MSRVAPVLLCLAIGLVVTVTIAWLGAFMEPQPGSDGAAFATQVRARSGLPRTLAGELPPSLAISNSVARRQVADGRLVRREQYPMTIERSAQASPGFLDVYAAGWPLRALEWTSVPLLDLEIRAGKRASPGEAWEFGIDYQRSRGMLLDCDGWRRLPIRPARYGLGLMVNTAVWGSLAWTMLMAPEVVRRQRRRSRGLCVACGYPVRDAGGVSLERCPECGTVVKPAPMPETGSPA